MNRALPLLASAVTAAVLLSACQSRDEAGDASGTTAAPSASPASGMPMQGMGSMTAMGSDSMMAGMQMHMQMMMGASAAA